MTGVSGTLQDYISEKGPKKHKLCGVVLNDTTFMHNEFYKLHNYTGSAKKMYTHFNERKLYVV